MSGAQQPWLSWSVGRGEGIARQDQPGFLGYTGGQMTLHKHCAVEHALKKQDQFFWGVNKHFNGLNEWSACVKGALGWQSRSPKAWSFHRPLRGLKYGHRYTLNMNVSKNLQFKVSGILYNLFLLDIQCFQELRFFSLKKNIYISLLVLWAVRKQ